MRRFSIFGRSFSVVAFTKGTLRWSLYAEVLTVASLRVVPLVLMFALSVERGLSRMYFTAGSVGGSCTSVEFIVAYGLSSCLSVFSALWVTSMACPKRRRHVASSLPGGDAPTELCP